MPCWTASTTTVDIDAVGVDIDRLVEAGREHGITVFRVGGRIALRDYAGRSEDEVARLVKQSYSALTVAAGLARYGYRVQSTRTEHRQGVGQVRTLKVGR